MALPEEQNGPEPEEPVIRDRRRIDPDTYEAREALGEDATQPADPTQQGEAVAEAMDLEGPEQVRQELAERTADLQRIQAEYANYRKRVDRDRTALRDQVLTQVLGDLVPILDDIGRAREHEELTGGFKSVGESLEGVVGKLGLKRYAQEGDAFDPNIHEALTMVPTPGLEGPTVLEVFQPGYQVGDRVIRPARVVVAGPAEEDGSGPQPAEDMPIETAEADAVVTDEEAVQTEARTEPREGPEGTQQ